MIKIFRKIRLDLMETGKTGKYLTYALGEIILVVIGILIAFQINNWKEEKAAQKMERQYIASLVEDVKTDITNLKSAIELNGTRIRILDSLTYLCFSYTKTKEKDPTLYFMYEKSLRHPDFVSPTDRTMAQLKSTGSMQLLKNKATMDALISYEDYFKKLSNQQVWYEDMLRALVEAGTSIFKYSYLPQTKNPEAKAHYNASFYQEPEIISTDEKSIVELGNRANIYRDVTLFYLILLQEGEARGNELISVLEQN